MARSFLEKAFTRFMHVFIYFFRMKACQPVFKNSLSLENLLLGLNTKFDSGLHSNLRAMSLAIGKKDHRSFFDLYLNRHTFLLYYETDEE